MPYSTWRDGSRDEWQQAPGLRTEASGAGTQRQQPPGALAWPRKTTLPKPQSRAAPSQSLFCGCDCLSKRSQVHAATGRKRAGVMAVLLQEGPRRPHRGLPSPAGAEPSLPSLPRLRRESLQRLRTKGLGRSLIKAALFSLGVLIGYYQIYFIPNLCSLARQRKGRADGSEEQVRTTSK